jgi:flagellar assembly protein FliH
LRKIIKSSNTEQVNTFRLHYFPNIPLSDATRSPSKATHDGDTVEGTANHPPERQDFRPKIGGEDRSLRVDEIERQAYREGYTQGQAEGHIAAQQASAPLLATLEETLGQLDDLRNRIRQQIEQEVVELALHVARKVVHHELTVSEEAILCVVQEAMNKLEDPGKISIRLHPEDLKRINGAGERLQSVMENLDNIHFEEDPGIDCGGCYIQTEYGEIDARVSEQLRAVEEAFRAQMHKPSPAD